MKTIDRLIDDSETPGVSVAGRLTKAIRDLARRRPKFVYQAVDGSDQCSNVEGGDPAYPAAKGCIVGQAFKTLGYEIPPEHEDSGVGVLLCVFEIPVTRSQYAWLSSVQHDQDRQLPWQRCVSLADTNYRKVKELEQAYEPVDDYVPLTEGSNDSSE